MVFIHVYIQVVTSMHFRHGGYTCGVPIWGSRAIMGAISIEVDCTCFLILGMTSRLNIFRQQQSVVSKHHLVHRDEGILIICRTQFAVYTKLRLYFDSNHRERIRDAIFLHHMVLKCFMKICSCFMTRPTYVIVPWHACERVLFAFPLPSTLAATDVLHILIALFELFSRSWLRNVRRLRNMRKDREVSLAC
jgi:hypothetical protein